MRKPDACVRRGFLLKGSYKEQNGCAVLTGQSSRLGSSVAWRTTSREPYGNFLSGKRYTNLSVYIILGQMK
ncbi:hypothetical protein D3C76_1692670 [compost metagenome]